MAYSDGQVLKVVMTMSFDEYSKKYRTISSNHRLCKDCIHNESANDKEYSAKMICGRHGKIVDIRDEACEDYEVGDNDEF